MFRELSMKNRQISPNSLIILAENLRVSVLKKSQDEFNDYSTFEKEKIRQFIAIIIP